MEKNRFVMGLWKFHERIGHKELVEVADKWAKDDDYVLLYIRQVSKDQNGIGFAYKISESEEEYDKYFDNTTDSLRRKFGNDLVGWDIGSNATVIKGL